MRFEAPINDSWTFAAGFEPSWVAAPLLGEAVELPHTAVELPLSYFDETSYQRPFTYQRVIPWEDRFEGREVHLHFEGAMADATDASTPMRLVTSARISTWNRLSAVAGPHATGIHFSGCLRNEARLPQASRWITTPRPVERLARIGSFGIGKQQRA